MRTHKRTTFATGIALAALLLAACGSSGSEDPVLADLGLDGMSGQELVEYLDQSEESRPLAFGASVREFEVLVSDGQTEVDVPLPEDAHYVSVAPFVESTHDCYYHSLATCQGELVGERVDVTITDDDGAVLVQETATTYANGFVGFWLPRDVTGTIEVKRGDLAGSVPFSTSEGDPTCITTLQLT